MSGDFEADSTRWELEHGRIASAHNAISTAIHHLDMQAARVHASPESVALVAGWMRRLCAAREPLAEYLDLVAEPDVAALGSREFGETP